MQERAREFLDQAIEKGDRVMTRRWSGDRLKFRRVYRDGDGRAYFRHAKGRTLRTDIVSAGTLDGVDYWFNGQEP